MIKCKRRFMHGKRRKRSPLHQDTSAIDTTKGDVDTTWVDRVYTETKVNEELEKSGHHSEKGVRGKKKSKSHKTSEGTNLGSTEKTKVPEGTENFA